ncbi:MAG: carboxypeptidase M32 [Deltaproteobacteria bacterium]|nr:carboxypeptidase M32 [Deltaproteobacteria bacterium]
MGLTELKLRVAELANLGGALDLLHWDLETYMPKGGVDDRASQVALLGRLAHEWFVADEVGRWLADAEAEVRDLDPAADDLRAVRVLRRDFDRERKVPTAWVSEFARTTSLAQHAWREARAGAGFEHFRPHLQRVLEARREYAGFFAPWKSVYDPLLDDFEPGTTTADVERLFAELRPPLVALVDDIRTRGRRVDASFLEGEFDETQQTQFGMDVLRRMGFDFDRGRQDRSAHPFTTAFSRNDVRITTRFDRSCLSPALFGSMHEGGHALYEQGIAAEYARTALGRYSSLGIHESQSRLWENVVGRGRPFWKRFYPDLQRRFPTLASVPVESFYRAINRVAPSLIRVEADEVTYNLHIMMRFDLELALLRGDLAVADLPAAWHEASRSALGIVPPDDASGVLQDIHWSGGAFAYFPTYTIGNLAALQLYDAAVAAVPGIPGDLERGEFGALLGWLRENVHRHGRKYEPGELLRRATGRPLAAAPYLHYLRTKYADVYSLP